MRSQETRERRRKARARNRKRIKATRRKFAQREAAAAAVVEPAPRLSLFELAVALAPLPSTPSINFRKAVNVPQITFIR